MLLLSSRQGEQFVLEQDLPYRVECLLLQCVVTVKLPHSTP